MCFRGGCRRLSARPIWSGRCSTTTPDEQRGGGWPAGHRPATRRAPTPPHRCQQPNLGRGWVAHLGGQSTTAGVRPELVLIGRNRVRIGRLRHRSQRSHVVPRTPSSTPRSGQIESAPAANGPITCYDPNHQANAHIGSGCWPTRSMSMAATGCLGMGWGRVEVPGRLSCSRCGHGHSAVISVMATRAEDSSTMAFLAA